MGYSYPVLGEVHSPFWSFLGVTSLKESSTFLHSRKMLIEQDKNGKLGHTGKSSTHLLREQQHRVSQHM